MHGFASDITFVNFFISVILEKYILNIFAMHTYSSHVQAINVLDATGKAVFDATVADAIMVNL